MIVYLIIIVSGIFGNTLIACFFLNGNYKNPEATDKVMVPVVVFTATSEIAIMFAMAKLAVS